jgi:predicted metal-dependent phosphoesterase TrpH
MAIDLHLHSTASDGILTPKELVEKAFNLAINAIALTDHDSVEGVTPSIKEGKKLGVEVIPAVELSSDLNGQDIHFLGYFINYEDKKFQKRLAELRNLRAERAAKMVDLLRSKDVNIPFEDVLEAAGSGAVGRAHVAKVMVKKGYIDTVEEAFEKYIGRHAPCYVEKYFYTPKDVIETIKETGGIAVLAHPALSDVDEFIPEFIEYGIQGIEVLHGEQTDEQSKYYLQLANEYNLLPTGGSDFHGLKNTKRGREMGSVKVPDEFLDRLKKLKFS